MGIFDRKPRPTGPSVPKPGDSLWWRGMRMTITEVDHRVVRYRNEEYRCTSALAEVRYNAELRLWYLPGTEGEMPKVVRGQVVDPEKPKCDQCGAVTFRRAQRQTPNGPLTQTLCTKCRLAAKGA